MVHNLVVSPDIMFRLYIGHRMSLKYLAII